MGRARDTMTGDLFAAAGVRAAVGHHAHAKTLPDPTTTPQEPVGGPPGDEPEPPAPGQPEVPGSAPSPVLGLPRAMEDCQVRGALRVVKIGCAVTMDYQAELLERGFITINEDSATLTGEGEDELMRLDAEHYGQLDEEVEIATAEAVAELQASGDLEPDEVIEDGEPVLADRPACVGGEAMRSYWDLSPEERRRVDTRRKRQLDQEESAKMNAPQPDLDGGEATPEARILFDRLEWSDDTHRFRVLYRLRGGRERLRRDDVNLSSAKKPKAKPRLIEADQLRLVHQVTRNRPMQTIADEAWSLVDRYDQALRAGEKMPEFHAAFDRLKEEANNGTHFGVLVYAGPRRLMRMLILRAGRAGRLPMWGVECKFRFECRGMHVIADMTHGLGLHLDEAKHRPGDLCWSETGFRSFLHRFNDVAAGAPMSPVDWVRGILERHIDEPKGKDGCGGLGGQLIRWFPWHVSDWQRAVDDELDDPEGKIWSHRDDGEQLVAERRAKLATAQARLVAEGYDLDSIGPPSIRRSKKPWPTFNQGALI